MIKEIHLTKGKVAIVNEEDADFLLKTKWTYSHGYAERTRNQKREYIHRIIMKAKKGQLIDHKNRNGLDNRRENLRISDKSVNGLNRGASRISKSGVRGVYKCADGWEASLQIHGIRVYRGWFSNFKKALGARKEAERKYLFPVLGIERQ